MEEVFNIHLKLQVVLDCKHFIIPGSARDVVPVSLVTNLKESLSEEDMENKVWFNRCYNRAETDDTPQHVRQFHYLAMVIIYM